MAQKVTAIVEKGPDGHYSCYVDDELPAVIPIGYGDTVEEAKRDLLVAVDELREVAKELNQTEVPELDITYKYDIQSFFNYFSFLNVSKIGEMAGINPSLMRQYSSGITTAGEKQYAKIRNVIKKISTDLSAAEI